VPALAPTPAAVTGALVSTARPSALCETVERLRVAAAVIDSALALTAAPLAVTAAVVVTVMAAVDCPPAAAVR
jgi:hypothetical protein